jgi:hypothetical protein
MADTHVTLTGNLTDDPDLRFIPNGHPVANFRLAATVGSRTATLGRTGRPRSSGSTCGGNSPNTSPSPSRRATGRW